MVVTRRTSLSPACSLAAGWTEPVASSQSLGQLQLDHAWLQEEHTTLQQERNDLVAERDRLQQERDRLQQERNDPVASPERSLKASTYEALMSTLGLVRSVLVIDSELARKILEKMPPETKAAEYVLLGLVWAVAGTFRIWLLLSFCGSLIGSDAPRRNDNPDDPTPSMAPCETSRFQRPLSEGACCPCPAGEKCDVASRLSCVGRCLRRAQQLEMGSGWNAPRLIGSELLECADSVIRDGSVDCQELVLFATRCFVPPNVNEVLSAFLQTLVTCDACV